MPTNLLAGSPWLASSPDSRRDYFPRALGISTLIDCNSCQPQPVGDRGVLRTPWRHQVSAAYEPQASWLGGWRESHLSEAKLREGRLRRFRCRAICVSGVPETRILPAPKVAFDSYSATQNIQRNLPHSYPTQPLFTTIETNKDPHFGLPKRAETQQGHHHHSPPGITQGVSP